MKSIIAALAMGVSTWAAGSETIGHLQLDPPSDHWVVTSNAKGLLLRYPVAAQERDCQLWVSAEDLSSHPLESDFLKDWARLGGPQAPPPKILRKTTATRWFYLVSDSESVSEAGQYHYFSVLHFTDAELTQRVLLEARDASCKMALMALLATLKQAPARPPPASATSDVPGQPEAPASTCSARQQACTTTCGVGTGLALGVCYSMCNSAWKQCMGYH